MSFLDSFLSKVRLVDDEDYEDDYYEDEYEDEEEEGRKGFFSFGRKKKDSDEENSAGSSKITAMSGGKSPRKMNVCVIKPSGFDDVKEIADTLLSNCTVILNMEGVDLALAQRIIDFMMGSCYSIDGNLQKISNYIFIITPASVGISGDLQGIVDAFETSRAAAGGGFSAF